MLEELPLTTARLIRIWWSCVWRFMVLTFVGGLVIALPMGVAAAVSGADPQTVERSAWLQLFFGLLGLGAAYMTLKWVMVLKWSDFRIVVVRADTNPGDAK